MVQCEARVAVFGFFTLAGPVAQCPQDAVSVTEGGCEHGHVKRKRLCAEHADDAIAGSGSAGCADCWHNDRQDVPVTARLIGPVA
jgi:hypothetical protein